MEKLLSLILVLLSSVFSCKDQAPDTIQDSFWQRGEPAANGLHPDSLNKAVGQAAQAPNFYALLVIRNQKILLEEYFKGKSANDLFHLRSITKNITSALSGVAIEEGTLAGLDNSIKPYFPDLISGEKEAISLRHLLNMSSGLSWDENGEIIDLIEHRIPNPVSTILSRNLAASPGSSFNYNSVSPHIVSFILQSKTGQSHRAYAEDKLFTPLGIENIAWTKDPSGAEWGGFGLQLRARDLARFGQLYLNKGRWEGRQLVPAAWVELSSQKQIDLGNSSSDYSLQWWIANNLDTPLFFGQGYGGQTLMIFPEKNMMIVAFHESLVSFEQSNTQWQLFLQKIFAPIYNSLDA